MCNICARFSLNAQYMHKICTRLYFFPQCAIYAQDLRKIVLIFPMRTIYVQDLHKIVLISPMRNICARFAQDCTSFPNAQDTHKICGRLYFSPQCAIYAQDCRYYWKKYVTYHISAVNLEWYSLHSYFWIAISNLKC